MLRAAFEPLQSKRGKIEKIHYAVPVNITAAVNLFCVEPVSAVTYFVNGRGFHVA
ncbi:MAG: hypothetical protein ACYSWR_03310 [Planctomycetota bacterium]